MISEYFKTIDECAAEQKDLTIANGSITHAAYLIKTFFLNATREVCIFTGRLFEDVFDKNDELVEAAIKFLKSNSEARLCIAYQDFGVEPDVILKRRLVSSVLSESDIRNKIEIYDARNMDDKSINHFAVMDGKAYRYELDHDKSAAVANFGDARVGEALRKIFQYIKNKSELVTLPA